MAPRTLNTQTQAPLNTLRYAGKDYRISSQRSQRTVPQRTQRSWLLWIIVEMANRLGLDWTYTHPSEVFAEMKLAMPSLDETLRWMLAD